MEELINPAEDSLVRFVRRWYGISDITDDVFHQSAGVPREIVAWHITAAAAHGAITFHDHPVDPTELKLSSDGTMTFWIENQGSYSWAVDPQDTSRILVRGSADENWQSTTESLGDFLLHRTVAETVLGADHKVSVIIPEGTLKTNVIRKLTLLHFPASAHEDPTTTLLCAPDVLAKVSSPPTGYSAPGEPNRLVVLATMHANSVEPFVAELQPFLDDDGLRRGPVEVSMEDLPF